MNVKELWGWSDGMRVEPSNGAAKTITRRRAFARDELVACLEEEIRVRRGWIEAGWAAPSSQEQIDKLDAVLELLRDLPNAATRVLAAIHGGQQR
jgi:predicted ATPase